MAYGIFALNLIDHLKNNCMKKNVRSAMNLKYYLADNPLTKDETDFRAVSKHERTITHEELVDMIVGYRNVGMTRSQILAVMEEYLKVIVLFLKNGDRIQTPFMTINPTVAGVFSSAEDAFDRTRHRLNLNVQLGDTLQAVEPLITPQKVEADKTAPVIVSVQDVASGTSDAILTLGQPIKVIGKRLKIDVADPQQGVFFVSVSNGKEVRGEVYSDNFPKKLTVTVPAPLAKGSYIIKTRAMINSKLYTAEYEGILKAQ